MTALMRKWHRWLGLGLGWLMLVWFISGAVMIYAHLPRQDKTAEGRARRQPPLAAQDVRLGFARAWQAAGRPEPLAEARLCAVAGQPAFVFRTAGGDYSVVWADSGLVLHEVRPELAGRAAQAALALDSPPFYLGLVDRDQWTVGTGARASMGPFHKFAAYGPDAAEAYVSSRTGEVCQVTTRGQRFWSWLGAVPHWLYFTALRQHREVWRWSIIILAAAGCVLCLTGMWLGVRFFRLGGYGRGRRKRRSAFVGLRKWHHYLGLAFGLPALALTFSGLMSLHPFDWHSPAISGPALAARLSGGPPHPEACALAPAQALAKLEPDCAARLLRLISFQGRPYLLALDGHGGSRLLPAWQTIAEPLAGLPEAELAAAARGLLPGHAARRAELLDRGGLYMPRWAKPVLRVAYNDPAETWVYLDPARARVVRVMDGWGRLNRWLYHFLHTLDLPCLLRREWLRQAVLLALLAGGALVCVTGPWAWLARRQRSRRRRAD